MLENTNTACPVVFLTPVSPPHYGAPSCNGLITVLWGQREKYTHLYLFSGAERLNMSGKMQT